SDQAPDGKLISLNEYRLWKDFKSGDVAAYSQIYRRYFFVLYGYGKKISNDNELVKDCIQDLFIKIWNNRENLNDTTSVKFYLFTSLKRKLIDTLKSPSQRLRSEEDIMDFEITDTSVFDDEASNWQKERVLNAMNKLSKHQQRLLQMKFYRNQSNQEIAEELGITIQSVYNSVFKTLRTIRKQLMIVLLITLFNLFA
ncbi:MAG: hypothetical protein C0490_11105, partial [Marivirga sp.]|nr:hypothetical protein [Marivirga sp.]